jgi:transposase
MPQPYPDSLRCALLLAFEASEGSLEELAEDFRVSYGYAKKIRRQQLRSGRMERPVRSYPPQSPLNEERRKKLLQWVEEQPDLTLLELQERLQQTYSLHLSLTAIWRALKKLGLRLKKNSTRRNSSKSVSNKREQPSTWKSVRSIRNS